MGSGKTTIGKALSERLTLPFLDLDHEIEKETSISVPEIFSSRGEIWFRKTEHSTLKNILEKEGDFVLSLGGGTPCYANNHQLITGQDVVSFYLKASIPTLLSRLSADANSRPLLSGERDIPLEEFIAKHLFERRYYYEMASYTVATDSKSVDEVAGTIEGLING